jgi:Ca2+-binding RTX toxin-like protein
MAFELEPDNDSTPQYLGLLGSGIPAGASVNFIVQSNGSQGDDSDNFRFDHSQGEALIAFDLTIDLIPSSYGGQIASFAEIYQIDLSPGPGVYGDRVRIGVSHSAGTDSFTGVFGYEESYYVRYVPDTQHDYQSGVYYTTDNLTSFTVRWYIDRSMVSPDDAQFNIYTAPIMLFGTGNAPVGYSAFEVSYQMTVVPTQVSLSTLSVATETGATSTVTATVTLADAAAGQHPLTENLVVDWQVVPAFANSADAADFAGGVLPSGQLTIPAGQSAATFSFAIANDAIVESDEQFYVVISNPSIDAPNVVVGTSSLTGTIVDDDGNAGPNTLTGTGGPDFLDGGDGKDVLSGGRGNDALFGGKGADKLSGGDGRDLLVGGAGRDTLLGGGGNDTLMGGAGKDSLDGGTGRDVYAFDILKLGNTDVDTFSGFRSADDTIWLDRSVFGATGAKGTLKSAAFHASARGVAHDRNDRIIYETDTGKLFYDADGTGATKAIHFATLSGHPSLSNADFLII